MKVARTPRSKDTSSTSDQCTECAYQARYEEINFALFFAWRLRAARAACQASQQRSCPPSKARWRRHGRHEMPPRLSWKACSRSFQSCERSARQQKPRSSSCRSSFCEKRRALSRAVLILRWQERLLSMEAAQNELKGWTAGHELCTCTELCEPELQEWSAHQECLARRII